MRVVLLILVILIFVLQIEVWRQWSRVAEMQNRVDEQRDNNRELARRNAVMANELDELRARLSQTEESGGLVVAPAGDGELICLVVDPERMAADDLARLRTLQAQQAAAGDDAAPD